MGSALLVMDYQAHLFARHGTPEALRAVSNAVRCAREAGVPVVFVRASFRPGVPEAVARNRLFSQPLSGGVAEDVMDEVGVMPDDLVVTKRRLGAFVGTDLELLLRALDVTDLVLAGLSTGGVVLSTLRAAADMDYSITVLSDACADADRLAHRVLVERVFPRQAEVMLTADWARSLLDVEP